MPSDDRAEINLGVCDTPEGEMVYLILRHASLAEDEEGTIVPVVRLDPEAALFFAAKLTEMVDAITRGNLADAENDESVN